MKFGQSINVPIKVAESNGGLYRYLYDNYKHTISSSNHHSLEFIIENNKPIGIVEEQEHPIKNGNFFVFLDSVPSCDYDGKISMGDDDNFEWGFFNIKELAYTKPLSKICKLHFPASLSRSFDVKNLSFDLFKRILNYNLTVTGEYGYETFKISRDDTSYFCYSYTLFLNLPDCSDDSDDSDSDDSDSDDSEQV